MTASLIEEEGSPSSEFGLLGVPLLCNVVTALDVNYLGAVLQENRKKRERKKGDFSYSSFMLGDLFPFPVVISVRVDAQLWVLGYADSRSDDTGRKKW